MVIDQREREEIWEEKDKGDDEGPEDPKKEWVGDLEQGG